MVAGVGLVHTYRAPVQHQSQISPLLERNDCASAASPIVMRTLFRACSCLFPVSLLERSIWRVVVLLNISSSCNTWSTVLSPIKLNRLQDSLSGLLLR